jgi:hypothetical protein
MQGILALIVELPYAQVIAIIKELARQHRCVRVLKAERVLIVK